MPTTAELALGITKQQIAAMQKKVDALERENDAIGLTRVRHAISEHLVSIRLLLRDGHTEHMNGGKGRTFRPSAAPAFECPNKKGEAP